MHVPAPPSPPRLPPVAAAIPAPSPRFPKPPHDEQVAGEIETAVTRFEDFSLAVVGESNYQDAIEAAAGGRTEESCEKVVTAVLVLENSNRHDRKAVQVLIDGRVCGYLSREDARAYRKLLKKAGYPDGTTSWKAMIVGGWDRGPDDRGHFGVKLNLPLYG